MGLFFVRKQNKKRKQAARKIYSIIKDAVVQGWVK